MDTKRLQSIRDWWQGPQDFEFWDEQAIRESKLLKKAREYIPALVDEIDRQAAEIERLQAYAEYADIDRRMAQELGEKAAEIAALTASVERLQDCISTAYDAICGGWNKTAMDTLKAEMENDKAGDCPK